MSKLPSLVAVPFLVALAAACSDSDGAEPTDTGGGDAGADVSSAPTDDAGSGGQGGAGEGEAAFIAGKAIAAVTSDDASAATFGTELFLDEQCEPQVNETGAVKTSFDGWYDYNQATRYTSPKAGTCLVKGVTGQLYKVQLITYFGKPDGTTGETSGRFVLEVGAL